jgi:hypothetical protein
LPEIRQQQAARSSFSFVGLQSQARSAQLLRICAERRFNRQRKGREPSGGHVEPIQIVTHAMRGWPEPSHASPITNTSESKAHGHPNGDSDGSFLWPYKEGRRYEREPSRVAS